MKILTPEEIEWLLGVRETKLHPLDILGYGFTSEGAHRFRAEQLDFVPQIVTYVQSVLECRKMFPPDIDIKNPGYKTFIYSDESGISFRLSTVEEISSSRLERFSSGPFSAPQAAREYVEREANPDYFKFKKRRFG